MEAVILNDSRKDDFAPSVRIGEMSTGRNYDELRTLLGSCIGLALFDCRERIGGLAHIVLPESRGDSARPGKYVDTAIPKLIHLLQEVADGPISLKAKLCGGASLLSTRVGYNIGELNIAACQNTLGKHQIPIVSQHCGGDKGRRMVLETGTGKVRIEIVGEGTLTI